MWDSPMWDLFDDEKETTLQTTFNPQEQEFSKKSLQVIQEVESDPESESDSEDREGRTNQQQADQLEENPTSSSDATIDASENFEKKIQHLESKLELVNALKAKWQEEAQDLENQLHLAAQREEAAQQELLQIQHQQEKDALAKFERNLFALQNDDDLDEKYKNVIHALEKKLQRANLAKKEAIKREEATQQKLKEFRRREQKQEHGYALAELENNVLVQSDINGDVVDPIKHQNGIQALQEQLRLANQAKDEATQQLEDLKKSFPRTPDDSKSVFGTLFRMLYWFFISFPLQVVWHTVMWSVSILLLGLAYHYILRGHNMYQLPDTSYFVNGAPGVV